MTPHKSAHKYPRKVRTNAQGRHTSPTRTNAPYVVGACVCAPASAQLCSPQSDLFQARYEPMPQGPTIATETWISRRLQRPDLFAGVTSPSDRRERVRAAILEGRMAEAIAGKRQGHPAETWRELFVRVYGESLEAEVAA